MNGSFVAHYGKFAAGLCPKKLCGISEKPNQWVGMTGQSSVRGTWCKPMVYQATISVLAIERFLRV